MFAMLLPYKSIKVVSNEVENYNEFTTVKRVNTQHSSIMVKSLLHSSLMDLIALLVCETT